MSSWSKPAGSKSTLKKNVLKAAFYSALLFAGYHYYLPNHPQDAVAKKVESLTHSTTLGHAFSSSRPFWQEEAPVQTAAAAPTSPTPPAPGK